jgi:hypothetical protein
MKKRTRSSAGFYTPPKERPEPTSALTDNQHRIRYFFVLYVIQNDDKYKIGVEHIKGLLNVLKLAEESFRESLFRSTSNRLLFIDDLLNNDETLKNFVQSGFVFPNCLQGSVDLDFLRTWLKQTYPHNGLLFNKLNKARLDLSKECQNLNDDPPGLYV